jgi:hypothetical protein
VRWKPAKAGITKVNRTATRPHHDLEHYCRDLNSWPRTVYTALNAAQLEANCRNAQQSTGLRTEAGKKTSSLNALRHGITSRVVVLPSEDL